MRVFLFLLSCTLSLPAFNQRVITGRIMNSSSKEPIPYANIGIKSSGTGTISNKDGSFSIAVGAALSKDTIIFSSLGFVEKKIPFTLLGAKKEISIYLDEKILTLSPVIVKASTKKNKLYDWGNTDIGGGVMEADTTYAGRAMALLIQNEHAEKGLNFPVFLEKAKLRILRNNLASFKVRVRIMDIDTDGKPGKDLLEKSVVLQSTMRKGWLQFDLSSFDVEVKGPFFLVFEQLLDLADRTAIADGYREFIRDNPKKLVTDSVEFEGKKVIRQTLRGGIDLPGVFIAVSTSNWAIKKYACYVRKTSLDDWSKERGIITATVTVSKQPGSASQDIMDTPCTGDVQPCVAEKQINEFMADNSINGMQVVVSRHNKIRYSANLGYADRENKTPVTAATRFRINSISKSVTSLALIKLVAEGKIDLDATVQTYLPQFPLKKYPVTIRQLAGHLAGLRDYDESNLSDYIRTQHYPNAIAALDIFKDDTLLFKPGTAFHYSVYSWNLLGAVIESVSGETYLQYMAKNIWTPLRLTSMAGDETNKTILNRSKFYDATGEVNDLGDISYKYPAGGLLSTATDLVTIGNELLHGKFIDPKLKAELFKPQLTADSKGTGYGLGWYSGKDSKGRRIWYHAGDSFSSSSHLVIYPDDDMVIAFLANSQAGTRFDIQALAELFFPE
jgi:CubicO group peptidase (beta-lactamase class C family)